MRRTNRRLNRLYENAAMPDVIKFRDILLKILKQYNMSYSDFVNFTKSALKEVKKELSNMKKASVLKPQVLADWLRDVVETAIQDGIDDSGPLAWYYDDYTMDNTGFANLLDDPLNDNWDDVSDELDPRELYDCFDDYFDAQSPNKQKQIINFVNNITFNYFNGNTDASWEDYADD